MSTGGRGPSPTEQDAIAFGAAVSDEQLMAALAARDLKALDVLYERHHRLALALARRILGDPQEAEDIVQEVFLSVWRQPERFRPERGSVRTWILAMVHHSAVDRLRRRSVRRMSITLDEQAPLEDVRLESVWQEVVERIIGGQISAALATLPPEQRQVIELAYYGGKSQSEIAELLGVPLGTVKSRTRLALEKLRGALIGLGERPA